MWGRSANLHLAQHYNALLSKMLPVYSTAPLSTTRIAIHIQRTVKDENSQDTSTIQTVLIQSILIGKESQKKKPSFWALLNLGRLQSIAKYKICNNKVCTRMHTT